MRTTIALSIALALSFAGCIQNMAGLKETANDTGEALEQTSAALNQSADALNSAMQNTSRMESKAPVARISIFASNGALLYKSTFQAEDAAEMVFADAKSNLSLIAGDSEAVEPGATLTGFAWSLDGAPLAGGRQASVELPEPAVYTLTLTVTDSKGKTDSQTVKIGVAPEPYEVVAELVTEAIAGAEGQGGADLAWTLAEPEKPATVQSVVVTASPPVTCDAILEVLDADGGSLGSADRAGHSDLDQTEEVTLGEIAFGSYTIRVAPFACVADAVPVKVVVTLLPIVEGLDGHGGHDH